MPDIQPTFAGEVQLRRWSESSTQGVQITFALADAADLERFRGMEGKRFMAALVLLGDDEQPVVDKSRNLQGQPVDKSANLQGREHLGDLCWRAVQWCRDPEFAVFIHGVFYKLWPTGLPGTPVVKEGDSAEPFCKFAVQQICGIESRKELDTNPDARRLFHEKIRGPYQKFLIARGVAR